ncbi:MAG: hypothetical protein H6562_10495 [Lewinellaceae bacterium]|nr:hypothetical protein [Lewinellaceae bacterium]
MEQSFIEELSNRGIEELKAKPIDGRPKSNQSNNRNNRINRGIEELRIRGTEPACRPPGRPDHQITKSIITKSPDQPPAAGASAKAANQQQITPAAIATPSA